MPDADVAVVGLGAWGSSALWQLAARGVRVLGFERYGLGHPFGASHGGSRMFRVTCLEHPGLVPLAKRSRELWRQLEILAGRVLFDQVSAVLMGPADGHIAGGSLRAAREHDLPVDVLDADDLGRAFPQHVAFQDGDIGVREPEAGLIRPEEAVRAAVGAAAAAGARVFTDTRVNAVELTANGAVVRTPVRDFHVDQVVVAAGPWLDTLVPGLPLETVRVPQTWFRPVGDPEPFTLDRLPPFMRELGDGGAIWGHGSRGHGDVKLGLEDGGSAFKVTPADDCDRGVTLEDWTAVAGVLAGAVPGMGAAPSRTEIGMFTRTPDKQFLIGRPHGDPRLVIGGGCNFHGFKHSTGIGEALADIVVGRQTSVPLDFTDPNRFL
ncbi:N-methyl-L-tryptophan oxidase [Dactylosporangium fulvum]|uniref:N-methyl-L-tryptophan oxidase n=1 Tax=Dactylosporangium fulvum TaxID=53359 RepID=A0ABY5W8I2_9ACTN|nr:N-methyl-L-tryptophan oxidase [Dactylosporangium fulvum]UWP85381.1 N-methyl-L-tryptophan oxidase [Dactylosporangium fulvum]